MYTFGILNILGFATDEQIDASAMRKEGFIRVSSFPAD
jgi:hypothetical protein